MVGRRQARTPLRPKRPIRTDGTDGTLFQHALAQGAGGLKALRDDRRPIVGGGKGGGSGAVTPLFFRPSLWGSPGGGTDRRETSFSRQIGQHHAKISKKVREIHHWGSKRGFGATKRAPGASKTDSGRQKCVPGALRGAKRRPTGTPQGSQNRPKINKKRYQKQT